MSVCRILVPGGRVACVVGDICLSRRVAGRHHVRQDYQPTIQVCVHAGVWHRNCVPPIHPAQSFQHKARSFAISTLSRHSPMSHAASSRKSSAHPFSAQAWRIQKADPRARTYVFHLYRLLREILCPIWTDVLPSAADDTSDSLFRRNTKTAYPDVLCLSRGIMWSDPYRRSRTTAMAAIETGRYPASALKSDPHLGLFCTPLSKSLVMHRSKCTR